MKNEIILFNDQEITLEVNLKDETVWLTQAQIAKLFDRDVKTISKHIINVFNEELDEESNSQKMRIANSDKPVTFYNLDVIISVGYRVKSKRGITFRKWANSVLKDYLLKGYVVNEKRLQYLEKTVKLIDIANRIEFNDSGDAKEVIRVIGDYTKALDLLDNYDHEVIKKPKGNINDLVIAYEDCLALISELRFNEESDIFALERDRGLSSIINDVYQTFGGEYVYKTIEERVANLYYLTIKNHVFIDGNKRIAATLFLYALFFYDILKEDGKNVIDNNTLVALTLLIAQSDPREKEVMIDLIMNFLIN